MTTCFIAGVCVGTVLGVVLLLAWAAWSVARETERAIRGDWP